MKMMFVHDWPLKETMIFEEQYHKELMVDLKYKKSLKKMGAEFIYLKDFEANELIGETYFIEIDKLDESLSGLEDWFNKNSIYVYSTTILPAFQGKGLGKVLKAYFLGYVKNKYRFAVGHAREDASIKLNKSFGAEIIKEEDNWQNTGERYYFYKIDLS